MLKRVFTILAILLIVNAISSIAFCQIIPFRNYTNKNGLIQNTVTALYQDKKGYIWLGTQVGLSQYNGKKFTNYNNDNNLINRDIRCIAEDFQGHIWVSSESGISYLSGKKFTNLDKKDGLLYSNRIEGIVADKLGRIWCYSDSGITILSTKGIAKTFTRKNGLPSDTITNLFEDHRGRMWIGTLGNTRAIAFIVNDKLFRFDKNNGFTGRIIQSISEDKQGIIWISTQKDGLFAFNGKNFKQYSTKNGLPGDIVLATKTDNQNNLFISIYGVGVGIWNKERYTPLAGIKSTDIIPSIHSDKRGNIWFPTNDNGIYRYANGVLEHYTTANSLINNQIINMISDSEGNTWIGTLGGVSVFGKVLFEIYTIENGLPDNFVLAVNIDKDNRIWASTYMGLISLKDNKITQYRHNNLNDTETGLVNAILPTPDNKLYLGMAGKGISELNNNTLSSFNYTIGTERDYVRDLKLDSQGNLWVATDGGLYCKKNNVEIYSFTTKNILFPSNTVYCIEEAPDKTMWVGTDRGLVIIDKGKIISTLTKDNGLSDNGITDITSTPDGTMWLATDNGVTKISKNGNNWKTKIYKAPETLASNAIFLIRYDGKSKIWIGHEKGLNTIDIQTNKINFYGEAEGFLPIETNMGAVTTDLQNNLWFGTVRGLVKYNPAMDYKDTIPPRTYITAIHITGGDSALHQFAKKFDPNGLPINLVLNYAHNTVSIDFIGIHLTIPEKNKYKYILEGYDEEWSEPSSETTVQYKRLPPGKYIFKVLASNCDDIWNEKPITFTFTVKPPFYRTTIAYIIEFILLIIIILGIIRYRIRALLEEKRILEEKVIERTAKIEQQKEEILTQRDEIAEKNKEITDSIYYAKRIQTAILPQNEKIDTYLQEYFILFKPRDIVSGDFYWIGRKQHKTVIVAADCTGHGVPGAFMSMLGVSTLNEIIIKEEVLNADGILNLLRENIKETLSQTGKDGEAKDGMDLALCVFDHENLQLQYAGANNPLWIVRNNEIIEYKADKMPIGIHFGEEKPFTNNIIQLQKNDMCYIFSDGYADQFGGKNAKKFKSVPFKSLILEVSQRPMNEQKDLIEQAHLNWKGELQQVDDILVIGFKI